MPKKKSGKRTPGNPAKRAADGPARIENSSDKQRLLHILEQQASIARRRGEVAPLRDWVNELHSGACDVHQRASASNFDYALGEAQLPQDVIEALTGREATVTIGDHGKFDARQAIEAIEQFWESHPTYR